MKKVLSLIRVAKHYVIVAILTICILHSLLRKEQDPPTSSIPLPVVLLVTPTYSRLSQKADLTRLSQTLLHVANIHWILVEDSHHPTNLVVNFIQRLNNFQSASTSGHFRITHLTESTPPEYKLGPKDPSWLKPRGVSQRNMALEWIYSKFGGHFDESHFVSDSHPNQAIDPESVIYFMDDDNTYDLRIFEEIRSTKRVSVWPVAFVGELKVEKPVVEDGLVIGFNSVWKPDRPFPVDMAGFAIKLKYLIKERSKFTYDVPRGYQESHIISQVISDRSDLEGKAGNCSEVLVWHTKTERFRALGEKKLAEDGPSDRDMEV